MRERLCTFGCFTSLEFSRQYLDFLVEVRKVLMWQTSDLHFPLEIKIAGFVKKKIKITLLPGFKPNVASFAVLSAHIPELLKIIPPWK